ncbi:unnamed protein product [Chilo suppressalis]|uniref:Protein THEM6 n=1 Tax=Chilo suppressalis TaxID=168631 RepID=A0ABN8BG54_CHISP|nr:unnamed protein product [Chilo suppressalis]
MFIFILVFVLLNISLDISYFLRTIFTVFSGRVYQKIYSLSDVSTIYGICTFLDCDIWFRNIRDARIIRELDFARFHFYDRTGIFRRSRQLGIHSLQGSTLMLCQEQIPLFKPYKITTQLVYWDDRSLFLEHKVITLNDNKIRYYLISRQYALRGTEYAVQPLLKCLPGEENKLCPENINIWLKGMKLSSDKLRAST